MRNLNYPTPRLEVRITLNFLLFFPARTHMWYVITALYRIVAPMYPASRHRF
jgi:hypothetical protein